MDAKSLGTIALKYYEHLCLDGMEFVSFDPTPDSKRYFAQVKVDPSELELFGQRSGTESATTRINMPRRREIAYAVLKFEMAFNNLHIHNAEPAELAETAGKIKVPRSDFQRFAIAMFHDVSREMATILKQQRA